MPPVDSDSIHQLILQCGDATATARQFLSSPVGKALLVFLTCAFGENLLTAAMIAFALYEESGGSTATARLFLSTPLGKALLVFLACAIGENLLIGAMIAFALYEETDGGTTVTAIHFLSTPAGKALLVFLACAFGGNLFAAAMIALALYEACGGTVGAIARRILSAFLVFDLYDESDSRAATVRECLSSPAGRAFLLFLACAFGNNLLSAALVALALYEESGGTVGATARQVLSIPAGKSLLLFLVCASGGAFLGDLLSIAAMIAFDLYGPNQVQRRAATTSCVQPVTVPTLAVQQPQQQRALPDCSVCSSDPGELTCTGTAPTHHFCIDCLNAYAVAAFQEGGSFCREIQQGAEISHVEELPCPFFERDGCSCSVIPHADLRSHLSEESFDQWRRASNRIAVARADQERRNVEQTQENRCGQNGVNHLLEAVREALNLGASVACPNCAFRGEKDEACMHITCENCRSRWCYCCGRPRRVEAAVVCTTCDVHDIYIQNHPGWNQYQQEPGEILAFGALHEFHRRRMAYFIRRLTEGVPQAPWQELWEQHGEILNQVPTPNRRISLQDIENAEPPVFDQTPLEAVQWLGDMDPIIARLRQELPDPARRNMEDDTPAQPRRQRRQRTPVQPRRQREQERHDNHQVEIDALLHAADMDPEMTHALIESLLLQEQEVIEPQNIDVTQEEEGIEPQNVGATQPDEEVIEPQRTNAGRRRRRMLPFRRRRGRVEI